MSSNRVFEQSIYIRASSTAVERCVTDLDLMHQWLHPALRCIPEGKWDTQVGSRCRFVIQIPLLKPTLYSEVVEREPGVVVWGFDGFFVGRDRWECQPQIEGTLLLNRFEFEIPNSTIAWGFDTIAANWVKDDMQAQLRRFKRVAERLYRLGG